MSQDYLNEDEEQSDYMWVFSHDTKMKHFIMELHCVDYLSTQEFLDQVGAFYDYYKDKPEELFDDVQTIDPM